MLLIEVFNRKSVTHYKSLPLKRKLTKKNEKKNRTPSLSTRVLAQKISGDEPYQGNKKKI